MGPFYYFCFDRRHSSYFGYLFTFLELPSKQARLEYFYESKSTMAGRELAVRDFFFQAEDSSRNTSLPKA